MLHDLITLWFEWVRDWGLWGVFILMALESTIVPVPSEIVLPPAAFWAAQGHTSFSGVVLAGIAGSYVGSVLSYVAARWLGLPILQRYGKYVLIPPAKLRLAEGWLQDFGFMGVLAARLIPVIRHLISIPAGVLRMDFTRFSIATIAGASAWCFILSWLGRETLGAHPELLDSPTTMLIALKDKVAWIGGSAIALALLYAVLVIYGKRKRRNSTKGATSELA